MRTLNQIVLVILTILRREAGSQSACTLDALNPH